MNDDDPFGSYGLARICLEHKPVFDSFFSTCQTRLSDYTFANTFVWRDSINLRWRILHDCLCVFANGDNGLTLLFPPMGEGDSAAAAREALAICDAYIADRGGSELSRIEYVSSEMLARLGTSGYDVRPMSGDYVYSTQRMIDLDGGDLASKRQAKNRFARRYDARTLPLGPEHVQACVDLLCRWRDQSEDGIAAAAHTCFKRNKEVLATCEALRHAPSLGLAGMVLYAGEQLVGFTLGEKVGDGGMCSILIEKTDREFVGSAQYIFSEFCRQYWAGTTWCNAGDDWEIPSLAWTKQSYRPSHRLEKYMLYPVRSVVVGGGEPAPVQHSASQPAQDVVLSSAPAAEALAEYDFNTAALDDLDRLHALEMKCFAKPIAISRRQLRYLLRSPNASVQVLKRDGEIVAEAFLLRRRTRGRTVGRIYSIAVAPEHRGKGYGKTLMKKCLDVLESQGASAVYLEVDVENTPAIAMYESFGFTRTQRLADYYSPGHDGWKMKYSFTPPTQQYVPQMPQAQLAEALQPA